jgi:hypothetical protein
MRIKYPHILPNFSHIPNIIRIRPIYNILNREYTKYEGNGRLRKVKEQINKNYLVNNDPQNLQDLKDILENLKSTSKNPKFNLGIEIIQTLLSHHKEEVIASALGNLFFIFDNRSIKNLIIKELRIRAKDPNPGVRRSARQSLKLISEEIHKFEAFEIIYGQFSNVFVDLNYNIHLKWKRIRNSIIKNNYVNKYLSSFLNYIAEESLIILDSPLNILSVSINEETIEDLYEENNFENGLNWYSDIVHFEQTVNPLIPLANIYALTFLEKGHLRRLVAFLDDEDYDVQLMGINGLSYAIESLINLVQVTQT